MLKLSFVTVLLLGGASALALAQPITAGNDKAVRHLDGKAIQAQIAKGLTPDAVYSEVVFTRTDSFRVMNTAREKSGEAEVHDDWTDNLVVQEGEATLIAGGTVAGAKTTAPGEHRGTSITGGTAMLMRPGDYFLIPAGTPHQMIVTPGKRVKFLAFKTKK